MEGKDNFIFMYEVILFTDKKMSIIMCICVWITTGYNIIFLIQYITQGTVLEHLYGKKSETQTIAKIHSPLIMIKPLERTLFKISCFSYSYIYHGLPGYNQNQTE